MTNHNNANPNACVSAPKDGKLPHGPFILPILLTAPWVVFFGILSLIQVCHGDWRVNDWGMVQIAGYIVAGVGLWFRQEWALWCLAVMTGVSVAITSHFLVHARWHPQECGLVSLFSTLLAIIACYQAVTCLATVVGGMVCRRIARKSMSK